MVVAERRRIEALEAVARGDRGQPLEQLGPETLALEAIVDGERRLRDARRARDVGTDGDESRVAADFGGSIYPVNAGASEVAGRRAYRSVRDVPPGVDLAVVAVPRDRVLGVVDDCAAAGVKSLVVITAGYAEAGDEGRAMQQTLVERVRAYGMRMVGPNCMGLLNASPAVRLNASFSPIFPAPGHVGLSSQSGALGLAILALASNRGVGLSTFVSVGNKADVSSNDLLEYWEEDDATRVILLYLESFGNPRRFARLARRIGRTKPIVVIVSMYIEIASNPGMMPAMNNLPMSCSVMMP